MGKSLAIVLDDKVFYTLVVRTAIESGVYEVFGSLTNKEIDYFVALAANFTLPVNLVKNRDSNSDAVSKEENNLFFDDFTRTPLREHF
jgi:hypothetical protein